MISYEISLGLSIVPVLMIFGDLNLGDIVQLPGRERVASAAAVGRGSDLGALASADPGGDLLRDFHDLDFRGDEPVAIRPAGVRDRAGGGLPHRVFAR